MKLSLDQGLDQLEAWVKRLETPAQPVPPVVHEQTQTKTQTEPMRQRNADSFLHTQDFKQRYTAAMEGTSPRAFQAREVEKKFNSYHADSFESFKRKPVELNPSEKKQLAFIRV